MTPAAQNFSLLLSSHLHPRASTARNIGHPSGTGVCSLQLGVIFLVISKEGVGSGPSSTSTWPGIFFTILAGCRCEAEDLGK